MGVSKNNGTPKSSILIGFFIINHPFCGKNPPIFRNIQMVPNQKTSQKTHGSSSQVFSLASLWTFRSPPPGFMKTNGGAKGPQMILHFLGKKHAETQKPTKKTPKMGSVSDSANFDFVSKGSLQKKMGT